jgi:hypothetical protein
MATARYHKVKIGEHELNAETLMLGLHSVKWICAPTNLPGSL